MAKPVEENYLITIKGTMEQNGENDTVELMTRGNFVQRGNSYYIVYAETEATGYAGCTTTVRVSQDARLVSMTRFGKTSSQLIIEKGIRHLCHYETGYGSISLGVAADVIENEIRTMQKLGIPMVVEGVEKLEQSEEMERLGVEYIQGYYYGKPLPEMECLRYIRNFNSAPEDYGR